MMQVTNGWPPGPQGTAACEADDNIAESGKQRKKRSVQRRTNYTKKKFNTDAGHPWVLVILQQTAMPAVCFNFWVC